MSVSSSCPKKCSSAENEITSFLSDLDNEISRQSAREKLTELRKSKEDKIRVRQDEIQVIDDILQFINQYQMKQLPSNTIHQSRNLTTEENVLNIFDKNSDLILLNSPLSGTIGDLYVQTNSKDVSMHDPLLSLFSPSTFNLLSPLIPFSNPSSNNYSTQDILHLPTTTDNPSIDKLFSENPFP